MGQACTIGKEDMKMSKMLKTPIMVTLDRLDGSGATRYMATRYQDADDDHARPYIEQWTARDAETGEPVEYRIDEEEQAGSALDEQLAIRLAGDDD